MVLKPINVPTPDRELELRKWALEQGLKWALARDGEPLFLAKRLYDWVLDGK